MQFLTSLRHCNGDIAKFPESDRITLTAVPEGVRIDSTGIGGHASHAENTINAIGVIANYLKDNDLVTEDEKNYLKMVCLMCEDHQGHGWELSATMANFRH